MTNELQAERGSTPPPHSLRSIALQLLPVSRRPKPQPQLAGGGGAGLRRGASPIISSRELAAIILRVVFELGGSVRMQEVAAPAEELLQRVSQLVKIDPTMGYACLLYARVRTRANANANASVSLPCTTSIVVRVVWRWCLTLLP